MKENIIAVSAFLFVIFLIIYGSIKIDEYSCHKKAISFENVDYGIFQGCMVLHKGRWIPLDNIRGFD